MSLQAKELVYKYKYRIVRGVEIEQMSISLAKQCALICVDEIIESIRHIIGEKLRVEYYLEVKQEIEKL
jgi:Na+-translocating ferredoxin:NAD+ oxidoreductase RnfE subunit